MNFGVGVGDFIAVGKLALKVYNNYKDAPKDFKDISYEIKSVHTIINQQERKFRNKKLPPVEQQELGVILEGCTNALKDSDKLLTKYKGMGAIERLRWDPEEITKLRARLHSNTSLLTAFITSYSQDEMQRYFESHTQPVNITRRQSILSLRSVASFATTGSTKEAWKEICRELHGAGITPAQILGMLRYPSSSVGTPGDTIEMDIVRRGEGNSNTSGTQDNNGGATIAPSNVIRDILHAAAAIGGAVGFKTGTRDVNGETPLFTAAKSNNLEVVRQLLHEGAEIESTKSATGGTSLDAAACNGHLDVVRLLLEKGASITATRSDTGSTPLYSAACNGHSEVVKLLVEKGANLEVIKRGTGSTPLDSAASNGHLEVARLLLEEGANIEATRSIDGATPLYSAASNGHLEVVALLLQKGANIEATRSADGATALVAAAYSGHLEVVRLLLENGANIEATTSDAAGSTPLDAAAGNGQVEVVGLLLEQGADIGATRSDGGTALDAAAFYGHLEVVRLLLKKGANIEATRSPGGTPLETASYTGNLEVVRLLLEKGANIEAPRNDNGSTALYSAAYFGHSEVVQLLLEKGANIGVTRNDGSTALHGVIQGTGKSREHISGLQLPASEDKATKTVKLLLASGVNISQRDPNGLTALALARSLGHGDHESLLVSHMKLQRQGRGRTLYH